MIVIEKKLADDQLFKAIYKAAEEYKKLLGMTYLIVGNNRNSEYFWFECVFRKKQFMHLLGIQSRTLSADEFLDKCILYNSGIGTGLTLRDCSPSRNHSRNTINEKSSCCAALLNIKDAKFMKVGKKDKISQNVDFSYAYGKEAILGFQKYSNNSYCYPLTLLPQNIDSYATKTYKVIFVLAKKEKEVKYGRLLIEKKDGIFPEHYDCFPAELKNLVEKNLVIE